MTQTRTISAERPAETRTGKLTGAILKGLTRMIESLGPQPQLQPIPVRARNRSLPRR